MRRLPNPHLCRQALPQPGLRTTVLPRLRPPTLARQGDMPRLRDRSMSAQQWCLGWPPERGPHVPDGALHETNAAGRTGVRLCSVCWGLWVRDDQEVRRG